MKAITLRSGKEVKTHAEISKENEKKDEEQYVMIEDEAKEDRKTEQKEVSKSTPSSFLPKIPFPQRLKKQKDEEQFSKFLEIFKKLQINVPFSEALVQMPKYAKFLKDLITNKRH